MTPEEFRKAGHELIDWIADYRQKIPELPVRAQVEPGEIRGALPPHAPEGIDDFSALLADLERVIVPGVTQVQHPMHFGWFPSNASLASVLGDIASSGMGTLGISWESCPSLTELEEVMCDWMRELTGLSSQWRGTIHDTASTACVTAMILARERASRFSKNGAGLQAVAAPLVVYSTAQAHSCVAKAVQLAGFGNDNLRMIAEDPWTRAMLPGRTGRGHRAGPGRRQHTRRYRLLGRGNRHHGYGSGGRDRRYRQPSRGLAARGRGNGRLGHAAARVPPPVAGGRAGRLIRLEPPQVDGHHPRYRPLLCS